MANSSDALRIVMVGLRGFPGVQGGVESHAEHLCPLLVEMGCDVTVLVRSSSQRSDVGPVWQGVKFVNIWIPKSNGFEAMIHTFLGVIYAAFKRPDILHIQAIGPSIWTGLARLLGLRVVVTHHGPDYDRQKWGSFARFVLRLGERWGMQWSNGRIVISKVTQEIVHAKFGVESTLIPNGVDMLDIATTTNTLDKFGLRSNRYVLFVGRMVLEKRHMDLIEAFNLANLPGWKLVLVGGAPKPDPYQKKVQDLASDSIVMAGHQTGVALQELFSHAGIFVLPSSHEGLPIVLLEALSYGLNCIISDIPANLEVGLSEEHYFKLGDISQLAQMLTHFAKKPHDDATRHAIRKWVATRYNWIEISAQTLDLYRDVTRRSRLRFADTSSRER